MTPLKFISHKNPFFLKGNRLSREIHTYSETDFIEIYKGYTIWQFVTNSRNDGSRKFDIVKDKIIVETSGGTIDDVRSMIDKI